MPPYDPYRKQNILDQLDNLDTTFVDDLEQREGYGESAYEFLGQALWGLSSGAGFGLPEFYDMIDEAATGRSNRLEEIVTSLPSKAISLGENEKNYAGDFKSSPDDRELTNAGKLGYSVGSFAGMIASFHPLTRGVSWGARAVGWGLSGLGLYSGKKAAQKIAQSEIKESFGNVLFKAGQKEGAKEFTEDQAFKISEDALDIVSKSSARAQGYKKFGDAAFQVGAKQAIKEDVLKTFKGQLDDNLLDQFADEVFNIATRRSPDQAMQAMTNAYLNMAMRASGVSSVNGLSTTARCYVRCIYWSSSWLWSI